MNNDSKSQMRERGLPSQTVWDQNKHRGRRGIAPVEQVQAEELPPQEADFAKIAGAQGVATEAKAPVQAPAATAVLEQAEQGETVPGQADGGEGGGQEPPEGDLPRKKRFAVSAKTKRVAAVVGALSVLGISSLTGFLVHRKNTQEAAVASAKEAEYLASAKEVDFASSLRTYTVNKVKSQQSIPAYSASQVQEINLTKPSGVTAADLKLVTRQGLVGLEEAFVNAEKKYGVNALFLVAIASLESANGTICFRPNNMFGYGSKGYDSKEACIYDVAAGLSNNYLKKGGSCYYGTTISAVHTRYAASSTWATKVGNNMTGYYSTISASRKAALKKLS